MNQNPKTQIVSVRFQPTGKLYDFDARTCPQVQPGDFVLVETSRGQQLGKVIRMRPLDKQSRGLKSVRRRATGADLALRQQWRDKEGNALDTARKITAQLNLPIKVAAAEYTFDGQRMTLLYVSEEKKTNLDRLLSQLQNTLDVRVDLRRIGPRDYAKLLGGYGTCGEMRCCSRFICEFTPVSIKMAKAQGVSLNPSDITGLCGRLRCCLVYEHEQYAEASKKMPRRKKRVQTPHGDGKVVDLLPLKGMVVVQIEDRRVEVAAEDVKLIPK